MTEDRIIKLQEGLSFAQQDLQELSSVMAAKDKRIMQLEMRVERLERLLRALSQRDGAPQGELLGGYPEDDPVPRSG